MNLNKPSVIALMVGSVLVVGVMTYFSFQAATNQNDKNTNRVVVTGNQNSNTSLPNTNNVIANTNSQVNLNTTPTRNTNTTATNTNSSTNTNTTTTTPAGNVTGFFAGTVDTWRPAIKTKTQTNKRTIVQYAYNLPLGPISGTKVSFHHPKRWSLVPTAYAQSENATDQAEAVTEKTWYGQAPAGKAYLKVNWFCSAALTYLSTTGRGNDQALGEFTGDCNNPNVSVKGNFVPTALGEFNPGQPVYFAIKTNYGGSDFETDSRKPDACVIDYIEDAGIAGVYASQFTCDDGLGISSGPTPDDIQFTVYVFPNNWTAPENPVDLLTTADKASDDDGDSLTYIQEIAAGTNPNNSDSDYDGLGDFEELNKYKTKPMVADTDKDGLKDGEEVAAQKNPLGSGNATPEQLAAWGAAPNQPGKTVISDITATWNNGTMIVSWKTSPNADGIVNWGPTTAYGQYRSDYAFSGSHTISFPVAAGVTIHYALRSCTPAPNSVCTVSSDLTAVGQ